MTRSNVALALLLLLPGCAVSRSWIADGKAPPAAPATSTPALQGDIDVSLFLIGDAGKPLLDAPEPVLETLADEAAALPHDAWIVFLGDNIYPDGIPEDPGSKKRREAEDALRVQVQASIRSGAQTIFVPGNHDHYSGGFQAVQRQAAIIEAYGEPRVRLLPTPGCPGPEVVDVGTTLRLVLLDSQWWMATSRRDDTPSSCAQRTPDEIATAVQEALVGAGERHTVVLAHHPLATHGAHGGFFSWREHLFPLVTWKSWLWVPIPILSSIYVGYRAWGSYPQDLGGHGYKEMIQHLATAYAPRPPLFHAAGHDHSLQVLEGSHNARWNLVSGAGTVKRPDDVGIGDDTVFVSPSAGYMRVDLLRDGRVRLDIVEVTKKRDVTRPFTVWLAKERAHAVAH